jgi:hypothetical protein
MLKRAILYQVQLADRFANLVDDPRCKYFSSEYSVLQPELKTSTWDTHQFVSIGTQYTPVIGFLEATIKRAGHYVSNLCIVKFSPEGARESGSFNNFNRDIIFAKDLYTFLTNLFLVYKYNKLEYGCPVGSPQEKMYDKYTLKYGGRIIGISTEHFVCESGERLDHKYYEIMRKDFLKTLPDYHKPLWKKSCETIDSNDII